MVMQIPSHLPDLNIPIIQRQDAAPVSPVVPVPGVPELAQALDSRAALRWAQPVFTSEQGQHIKNASESIVSPKSAPAVAVLLELDAHVSAGELPTQVGRWLSTLASRHQGQAAQWPAPSTLLEQTDANAVQPVTHQGSVLYALQAASPIAQDVLNTMRQLYVALAQSLIFTASRLVGQPPNSKPGVEPNVNGQQNSTQLLSATAEGEAIKGLAQRLEALSPDSPDAQLAAQCLTTGAMLWSGQLVPGMPAEIKREDAWREATKSPGQLEKGVSVILETQLEHLGKLKIVAQQWGDERAVTMLVQPIQGEPLKAQVNEIQAQLTALGVQESRIQEFAA